MPSKTNAATFPYAAGKRSDGVRMILACLTLLVLLFQTASRLNSRKPPVPLAAPLWSFSFGHREISRPLVNGNLVYVFLTEYTDLGHIYAFDSASGQKLWDRSTQMMGRQRFEGKLNTTPDPLAVGGRLYYLSSDERIHALDGVTGHELWQYGPVFSFLAATADTVFLLEADRRLILLDKQGHVDRRMRVEKPECSRLAVENTVMLVLSCSATSPAQAFDLKTGRPLWSSDRYRGSVLLANGIGYCQSGETMIGFEAAIGNERWTYTVHKTPDPRAGAIIHWVVDSGSGDPSLYLLVFDIDAGQWFLRELDGRTGALRRTVKLPWREEWLGEAAIFDRLLYMTRYKGHDFFYGFNGHVDYALSAVDTVTGQELWRSPWRFAWFEQPVASQGRVYVTARGEQESPSFLYAFQAGRQGDTHSVRDG